MYKNETTKPVGERFSVTLPESGEIVLTVTKTLKPSCNGCYFYNKKTDKISCIDKDYPIGPCSSEYREDNMDIVFMSDKEKSDIKTKINNFGKGRI